MRSRSIRALGLSLALAGASTAVAGCSGGGDKADDAATTTSTNPTASSTTTAPGSSTSTTGGDTSSSTTATTTANSSTTAATGTTATTVGGRDTTAGLGQLAEGSHYGYFGGIRPGRVEGQAVSIIEFDKVDLLTGQAAKDAAEKAGDPLDTDYYIRNDNGLVRKLPVIPDSSITVLAEGGTNQIPAGIEEVASTPGLYKIEVVVVRGISLITGIEGVYLP